MKKMIKSIVAIILCFTCMLQPCTAFSATFTGKTYVKELILGYGKTEADAKSWLQNRGYKFVDDNLNAGADDTFSTKRAVYLGYKTTSKASEAITDMKVMNMNGGYSVQDYQMLVEQQKADIQEFVNSFIVAINEFRENYKNGQQRALTAFEVLNHMYDNDTEEYLGDLFIQKVKEEYTEDEFAALSKKEQSKVADLTTILMQGNSTSVLVMEQAIALASDDNDKTWIDRYQKAKSYDEMVDDLMENDNLTVSQAAKKLAAEYDVDAKTIASKFEEYATYLKNYTDAGVSFDNTQEEIEAYAKEHEDFDMSNWLTVGTQYNLLESLVVDDVSLLDLVTSDEYDVEGEDAYLLYPLVASLTKGQRICLGFITMSQIVSMGINDDKSIAEAAKNIDIDEEKYYVSIYSGMDRSIFSENVALTGDAYALQNSSNKAAVENWTGFISSSTKLLYVLTGISMVATIASWTTRSTIIWNNKVNISKLADADFNMCHETVSNAISETADRFDDAVSAASETLERSFSSDSSFVFEEAGAKGVQIANGSAQIAERVGDVGDDVANSIKNQMADSVDDIANTQKTLQGENLGTRTTDAVKGNASLQKWMTGFSVAISCITIGLMVASLWSSYQDLKKYYNAEFTPIPMHMVNQGVNDKDEKVFTYYTAVKCNREEAQMVTDNNKLLEDYGDLNGDVGRQWVALYTTKDSSAGDPITTDFDVQYGKSDVPDDSTPLSMFCESTAQNLTNKKAGYTYADSKKGIYLFYDVDSNAYAGSVFSSGTYALIAGASMVVVAAISCLVCKAIKKKKAKSGKGENANA